jgi:hypothetical protein
MDSRHSNGSASQHVAETAICSAPQPETAIMADSVPQIRTDCHVGLRQSTSLGSDILIGLGYVTLIFEYRIILVILLLLSITGAAFSRGVEHEMYGDYGRLMGLHFDYDYRHLIDHGGAVCAFLAVVIVVKLVRIYVGLIADGRSSRRWFLLFVMIVLVLASDAYYLAYNGGMMAVSHLNQRPIPSGLGSIGASPQIN